MRLSAIRPLMWKELRQIGRNRTAMITASLLPFVILLVAPVQLLVASQATNSSKAIPPLPGFADTDPAHLLVQFLYPLLLVLGGLLLPSLTTTYAIVAERERRSLELLVSLPVSVAEILTAKLASVLVVTAIIGVPYVAIVLTLLLALGVADAWTIPALLAPFMAAIVCSTAIALLLTLLARDFRTANNLNGVFFVPALFVSVATLSAVPGQARTYVLALLLLVLAFVATFVALKWVSFERYLE